MRQQYKTKEYYKRYKKNPWNRFKLLIVSAKRRNIIIDITYAEFLDFWDNKCVYCGFFDEGEISIDRIDSLKGYTIDNCVSCCGKCNMMKKNLSKLDFIEHCKKIVKYNEDNKLKLKIRK